MLSISRESSVPEIVEQVSKHMLSDSEAALRSDSIEVGMNVTHYTRIVVTSSDDDATGAMFMEALASVLAQLCSDKFAKRVSKAAAKNSIAVRCDSKTNSSQVALRTVIQWVKSKPVEVDPDEEGGDEL